jgi:hypothetical protein
MVFVACLAVLALAGCNHDQCGAGDVTCKGNSAMTCEYAFSDTHAPLVWREEACGTKSCVVATGSSGRTAAFCAIADAPQGLCGAEDWSTRCSGGSLWSCRPGHAVDVQSCGGSDRCVALTFYPSHCLGGGPAALECPTTGQYRVCADPGVCPSGVDCSRGVVYTCNDHEIVGEELCPEGTAACAAHGDAGPTTISCSRP